ncbi:amidase [Variovorax sp. VNK109]|uniref:amidase n=1 Tax=Variovorax sp. VNK109 TaxID=3400919 RepID=UPI003C0EDA14
MLPDLHSTRQAIAAGSTTATAEIEKSIATAASARCDKVFLKTSFDTARAASAAGGKLPLAGLAISVKDLFDMAGDVTASGSVVLGSAEPAVQDATAVARLRAAGGAVLGRTNMSEFAFSGVGINPHFGTPANVADGNVHRIPGGSSSGAAISVATGAAFIGLGSDTGGSIRIPAALNGIVGFKNTARLVPTTGALPLSTTLDTVCAMTRSVRDAVLAHEILSATKVAVDTRPLSERRFAVARTVMLDGVEPAVATAFERTVRKLRDAGAKVEEIALSAIGELAGMQSAASFSPAESYAWHRKLLASDGDRYDPRVKARMERGATMSAADYIDLVQARARWIAKMQDTLSGFDAVLSPTVPIVAPTFASIAPGATRDEEFFRVNALLLRNPGVINMLDGCAISIPCHVEGELPVGLMLWHAALHDDHILSIAAQAEALLS